MGLHDMTMERSCSMSWRGVQRSQCSPKHNAFDSSGFLCLGDPPLPFLPQTNQGQAMETASARAHKQTTVQATIQEAPKAVVSLKTRVRHVLEESSGMDTDGHALVCSKSIHQRSQSTGCVLVRKAPTNSQTSAQQVKGRRRWGFKRHPRQGVNVKSTWPGCEVKLGTCHCLQYHSHMFHTRIPGLSSPTTEGILCGGDPPRGLSDETTSLGAMGTAMERKPTPALQALAPGRLLLGE